MKNETRRMRPFLFASMFCGFATLLLTMWHLEFGIFGIALIPLCIAFAQEDGLRSKKRTSRAVEAEYCLCGETAPDCICEEKFGKPNGL